MDVVTVGELNVKGARGGDTKGRGDGTAVSLRASPQVVGNLQHSFSGNLLEALRGFYLRSPIEQLSSLDSKQHIVITPTSGVMQLATFHGRGGEGGATRGDRKYQDDQIRAQQFDVPRSSLRDGMPTLVDMCSSCSPKFSRRADHCSRGCQGLPRDA